MAIGKFFEIFIILCAKNYFFIMLYSDLYSEEWIDEKWEKAKRCLVKLLMEQKRLQLFREWSLILRLLIIYQADFLWFFSNYYSILVLLSTFLHQSAEKTLFSILFCRKPIFLHPEGKIFQTKIYLIKYLT